MLRYVYDRVGLACVYTPLMVIWKAMRKQIHHHFYLFFRRKQLIVLWLTL
jgi:hypothetical protein